MQIRKDLSNTFLNCIRKFDVDCDDDDDDNGDLYLGNIWFTKLH